MKQKLFTILTLLVLCVTGAWAQSATNNPATVSYGTGTAAKTFLNVANTVSNTTIKSGNVACVTYGLYELHKNWKPAWATELSNGSSSSANYTNASDYGFMAGSSAGSGTAANKSATSGYGLIKYSNTTATTGVIYVTGITGIAVMGKDNGTKDEKRLYIKVEEYKADGTCTAVGTGDGITKSSYSTSLHITTFDAGTLDGTKYYKVSLYCGTNQNAETSQIRFTKYIAPAGPTISSQSMADASYAQSTAAADVTALSVTATASAGTLKYQWFKNTANSTTDPAPIAVTDESSADGANTYKPLTTADELGDLYYFCKVTDDNGSVYSNIAKITVSEASAPTAIDITGAASAARGADAITLTADVTGGVPTPTIQWFQCDDALKTNPVSQGEASTTNTTLNVATATVGTYYFYAVASNSQGNVASDVKTVTIVPKAPTLIAGGYFFGDSKEITIAKADGEDAYASIMYKIGDGAWTAYNDPFNVTETSTVKAKVVQGTLESSEVSATYTKFVKSELATVSGITTWNFNNDVFNTERSITASTSPALNEELTYADFATIKGFTLPSGFDGTTLTYVGSTAAATAYPTRNKGAQAVNLHINTTVPGKLTVTFSDTGSGVDASAVKRYLNINDVNTEFYTRRPTSGSTKSNDKKTVTTDVISAGDIRIKAMQENGTTETMVCFYDITFTPVATGTITASGWNTFSSSNALDLSTISGGAAYVASATSGNSVTLTPVTDKIVAAGTGMMIKGTAGEAFTIDATSAAATFSGTNLLVGMPNGGEVAKADNTNTWNYVFGWTDPADPGFYLVNADLPTLGAGKAYLQTSAALSTETPARLNLVFDGETTAINGIEEVAPVTKTRKVVKNGRLVIETANGEFTVSGARVK